MTAPAELEARDAMRRWESGTRPGICEDCRFWDTSVQAGSAEPDTTGACRRSTPHVDDRTGLAMWPFTEAGDWCGEFRESKR